MPGPGNATPRGSQGAEQDQARDDATELNDARFDPDPSGGCKGTDASEDAAGITPKGQEDGGRWGRPKNIKN